VEVPQAAYVVQTASRMSDMTKRRSSQQSSCSDSNSADNCQLRVYLAERTSDLPFWSGLTAQRRFDQTRTARSADLCMWMSCLMHHPHDRWVPAISLKITHICSKRSPQSRLRLPSCYCWDQWIGTGLLVSQISGVPRYRGRLLRSPLKPLDFNIRQHRSSSCKAESNRCL